MDLPRVLIALADAKEFFVGIYARKLFPESTPTSRPAVCLGDAISKEKKAEVPSSLVSAL